MTIVTVLFQKTSGFLMLQAVDQGLFQQVDVGRLGNEMSGAQLQHFFYFLFVGGSGIYNDGGIAEFPYFSELYNTLPAIHEWHIKIYKNKVRDHLLIVSQELKGLDGIMSNDTIDGNPGAFDGQLKHFTIIMVVID